MPAALLDCWSCGRDKCGMLRGCVLKPIWEFPKMRGTLLWGPDNKDPTI